MPGQGWKLLTVRLSGTGKNSGGHLNILGIFPKERLKELSFIHEFLYLAQSRTGKNNGGQVDFFDTFSQERQNFSVISIPVPCGTV